jgi:hypothetical protein
MQIVRSNSNERSRIKSLRRKRCCCFWNRLVRLNDSQPYTCEKMIPPKRRVRGRGFGDDDRPASRGKRFKNQEKGKRPKKKSK